MAQIKVHGSVVSTNTGRVLACLHEKGLDFQFVPVDMRAGEHKREPFLKMNPFGQLPVLQDGDLTLFESRAITQHVAHTYADKGTNLIFFDGLKMTTLAMWIEVESQQFNPVASKLAFEHFYKPMLGMGRADEATVAELEPKLAKVLDVYEARLGSNKYISGEEFGLADLHHLPVVHILMDTPSKKLFQARPRVGEWAEDILSRPGWCKVLAMQKTS